MLEPASLQSTAAEELFGYWLSENGSQWSRICAGPKINRTQGHALTNNKCVVY
jgi:hypothetical protein